MPRLVAADVQRSDDPDLEAPAPAPAASPSPKLETAPDMHCVTGTFADPSHESAFAAQLFRMAYPAHVVLLALLLASACRSVRVEPGAWPFWVAMLLAWRGRPLRLLLALVGRVLLHRIGSRDPVRSQRLGGWAWAVGVVLSVAVDMAGFITGSRLSCAVWKDAEYMLPFGLLLFALVNGSHGLGFACKFALVALPLTDCIVGMSFCHDPELNPWVICAIGSLVVGAAATHTAELYLRRSYSMRRRCASRCRDDAGCTAGRRRQN